VLVYWIYEKHWIQNVSLREMETEVAVSERNPVGRTKKHGISSKLKIPLKEAKGHRKYNIKLMVAGTLIIVPNLLIHGCSCTI